jgi:hypothetical protein
MGLRRPCGAHGGPGGQRKSYEPEPSKIQPDIGEIILFCGHDDAHTHHWLTLEEPEEFTRPDGTTSKSRWICLCEACFSKYDPNEPNEGQFIHADFVWDEDCRTIIGDATQ